MELKTPLSTTLEKILRSTRFSIRGIFPSIEIDFRELVDSKPIDDRIAHLDQIHKDLIAASQAVETLKSEAVTNRDEVENLRKAISVLEQDRKSAEIALDIPEESFSRLISRATSRGRTRGIIEGVFIGLVTGGASSWLGWSFTK